MFRRRSTNCCKSTSTSASSRRENYLDLGQTTDDEKCLCHQPERQEFDQRHPLCPPRCNMVIRRDLSPIRKESKHRVQIKFIHTNKPIKTEDHKLMHVVPSKSNTSGSNLDEKAVPANSNPTSHIIPITNTSNTETTNIEISEDVIETMKINDSEEAEQKSNRIIETSSEETPTKIIEESHQHDNRLENQPNLRSDDIGDEGEQEKMEDLIHVVPSKSNTSGSNLDKTAVSANSNPISYIIPITRTSNTETTNIEISEDIIETMRINDSEEAEQKSNRIIETSSEETHNEITEESHQYDNRLVNQPNLRSDDIGDEGEQEKMEDLIEKFKSEALNTDDEMFEKLFERLKNELDLLSCECTGPTVIHKDISLKFEDDDKAHIDNDDADVHNNTEDVLKLLESDEDSRRNDYLGMQEMRDMFAELKLLLEKKLSDCKDKNNNRNIDKGLKTSTDIAISTTSLGDINDEYDSLSEERRMNAENLISKSKELKFEKITADNTLNDLVDLYDKISAKIDEIACQCHSDDNRISEKNNDFLNAHDFNQGSSYLHTQSSQSHIPDSIQQNIGNEREMEEIPIVKEKLANVNNINAESKCFIPLDQLVNLANELKEAVYTYSCKCTEKINKCGHSEGQNNPKESSSGKEISLNFTKEAYRESIDSSAPHPNMVPPSDPSTKQYSLLEKAAEIPVNILDIFSKPKSQPNSSPIVDSLPDSFYSAESSNCQTASGVIHKGAEEVGVNTPCRCLADQVVQTFEDMKISYGVFCDGQLPRREFPVGIPDIEIRRKTSQGGDLEKVQVRIRLKEGEMELEPEDCVTTVMKIGETKKVAEPLSDYEIKCETTQSHIDETKVVKAGKQIKIFIPLDNYGNHWTKNQETRLPLDLH